MKLILDGDDCGRAAEAIAHFRESGGNSVRRVAIDTCKTVFVPERLCGGDTGADYLRFSGLEPLPSERVVVSAPDGGVAAVIALKEDVYRLIIAELGDRVCLTSPVQEMRQREKREVGIFLTRRNVYLAVWEGKLRMAEVLPDPSVDSLLYYMQVVGRDFELRRFSISVGGEGAANAVRELGGYFDRVAESGTPI